MTHNIFNCSSLTFFWYRLPAHHHRHRRMLSNFCSQHTDKKYEYFWNKFRWYFDSIYFFSFCRSFVPVCVARYIRMKKYTQHTAHTHTHTQTVCNKYFSFRFLFNEKYFGLCIAYDRCRFVIVFWLKQQQQQCGHINSINKLCVQPAASKRSKAKQTYNISCLRVCVYELVSYNAFVFTSLRLIIN